MNVSHVRLNIWKIDVAIWAKSKVRGGGWEPHLCTLDTCLVLFFFCFKMMLSAATTKSNARDVV